MLGVKRYELATGHVLLGTRRESVSRFSRRLSFLAGTVLPHLIRYEIRRIYRALWTFIHTVLAHAILRIEHWLEGLLRNVQEKTTDSRGQGEASAFLREVGAYKKKLAETSEINKIEQD